MRKRVCRCIRVSSCPCTRAPEVPGSPRASGTQHRPAGGPGLAETGVGPEPGILTRAHAGCTVAPVAPQRSSRKRTRSPHHSPPRVVQPRGESR